MNICSIDDRGCPWSPIRKIREIIFIINKIGAAPNTTAYPYFMYPGIATSGNTNSITTNPTITIRVDARRRRDKVRSVIM
jgi:hypothetical protein